MPYTDKGRKLLRLFTKQYSTPENAERVLYGAITKGTIRGALPAAEEEKLRKRHKGETNERRR